MYEIYMVKVGDTLEGIAKEYETTVGVLEQINGILGDYGLSSGTQIIVPVKSTQPYQYYTVQKGDNLYDIARKNDIDYSMLLQLNGLDDGDYIYPNQTIILPNKGIDLYITKDDDTLDFIIKKFGITVDEMLKNNENIYLRPEQILVFREK